MTIAIVTQPLMNNYGGLLQNWALQQVLNYKFKGATIITFDQVDNLAPLYLRIASRIKKFVTRREKSCMRDCFELFKEQHIVASYKVHDRRGFKELDKLYCPDVYIVGSDQVWRPSMVFDLKANFLGFTSCLHKVAYAASFGVDFMEFSARQLKECRRLLQQFSAISVREDSGVELCATYFNCQAKHVLDPTLLLSVVDYRRLMDNISYKSPFVFTYILDTSPFKQSFVKLMTTNVLEINSAYNKNGDMCMSKMTVGEWLATIYNADKVICDSFHGAAFSIIFNKDFYVLTNPERGNARLFSLLDMFGLSNRLISEKSQVRFIEPIEWEKVNAIRRERIQESITFLYTAICQ